MTDKQCYTMCRETFSFQVSEVGHQTMVALWHMQVDYLEGKVRLPNRLGSALG